MDSPAPLFFHPPYDRIPAGPPPIPVVLPLRLTGIPSARTPVTVCAGTSSVRCLAGKSAHRLPQGILGIISHDPVGLLSNKCSYWGCSFNASARSSLVPAAGQRTVGRPTQE